MKIKLNPAEVALAKHLAERRYSGNRNAGVASQQVGPQDIKFIDLNGVGGEIAAAKALNVYPDFDISPRAKGCDLVSPLGKSVDVKTTTYRTGRLISIISKEQCDCDIYVLVIGELPDYDVVGWCTAEEFIKPENVKDIGHGPTYVLDQSALTKL